MTDAIPKDDMGSMEHPIFSLATKPDLAIREYEHNGVKVTIMPSTLGLATIHDKDILIYCISQLIAKMNAGIEPHRTLHIKAYDLLVSTNRNTDGRGYEQLVAALDRLSGTTHPHQHQDRRRRKHLRLRPDRQLEDHPAHRFRPHVGNPHQPVGLGFQRRPRPRGADAAPRLFPAEEAAGTPHV